MVSLIFALFIAVRVEEEKNVTKTPFIFVLDHDTYTKVDLPHTLEVDFQEHGHEEADTLIPFHAIDCL